MPSRLYLIPGSDTPLRAEWKGSWKELRLSQGEQVIGIYPDARQFKQEQMVMLADSRMVSVRFQRSRLKMFIDGKPLKQRADPHQMYEMACGFVYVIGGATVLWSLFSLFNAQWLALIFGLLLGALLLTLAYTASQGSKLALGAALVFYLLDSIYALYALSQGQLWAIVGFALRPIFLIYMFIGLVWGQPKPARTMPATQS